MLDNKLFENYRLWFLLGKENQSELWLANHLTTNQEVVIRLIPSSLPSEVIPEADEQVERELSIFNRLKHPNILPLLGYGRTKGYLYLITPYLPNGSLQQPFTQAPLSQSEALNFFAQVLSAMSFAHRQGVFHGALKPTNLLLGNDLRAALAGFGVAKIESDNFRLSQSNVAPVSSGYLAPEQLAGRGDYRSDIYNLGIILSQLLADKRFYAPTLEEETKQAASSKALVPSDEAITAALQAVVKRALQERSEQRFANAGEMKKAFDYALVTSPLPQEISKTLSLPRLEIAPALDNLTIRASQAEPNSKLAPTQIYPVVAKAKKGLVSSATVLSTFLDNSSSLKSPIVEEKNSNSTANIRPDNAVTAPYFSSNLVTNLAETELAQLSSSSELKFKKGTRFSILLWSSLIFLLLLAIGLAVLVVSISLA